MYGEKVRSQLGRIFQQLTIFHELLKKEDNNVVKSWLANWTSFCKRVGKTKTMPPITSNSSSISIDMRESTNHGFSFGTSNSFYSDNRKVPGKSAVKRTPPPPSQKKTEALDRAFRPVEGPQGYEYVYLTRARKLSRTDANRKKRELEDHELVDHSSKSI